MIAVERVGFAIRAGFLLRPRPILREVSLRIGSGGVFGLVGPNGAGKTSLLYLLAGLRRPTSGAVTVAGRPAHSLEAKRAVGFLPERPCYPEHLTGPGLLRYVGALSGVAALEVERRIPALLARVGLDPRSRVRLRGYSKGMLQRIGIAQLLVHDARVLILDEPMSGLDPIGRAHMKDLVRELEAEGRTLVFSTHSLSDVDALCSDVAILDRGRVVYSGPLVGLPRPPTGFTIQVEPLPSGPLAGELAALGATVRGATIEAAREEDLSRALALLLSSGARIRAVRPAETPLESVFRSLKETGA